MSSKRRKVYIRELATNTDIALPVTPFVTMQNSVSVSTQDLFGFGEIETGSSRKLSAWKIESFLPADDIVLDFDIRSESQKMYQYKYLQYFTKWLNEQTILRFFYFVDNYNENNTIIDCVCKLTSFDYGEKNGNRFIYYSMGFRQYKELKLESQNIVNSTEVAKSYGSDTYYVGEGDTLMTIAAKIYGDSTKWKYLMTLNNLSNPLNITAGQALLI